MGEVFEASNPASDPESPAESSTGGGGSPPSRDELEPPVLEGLAEEETVLTPAEELGGSSTPGAVASVATADTAPLLLDAVQRLGEQLTRRLDSLQTILQRELRAEAARERVIDRLHTELQ